MITYFYKILLLATSAVSVTVDDQVQITNYAPNHENYEPAEYAYSYGVSDPLTGDQKHHWEKRQGDKVQGEYGLMEPDGYARIVQYTADPDNGFQANVKRIHVPATEKTQGKPLYAEKDQEQLYDNVRYGVTITHNVAQKQEQTNTHRVQQRVDNNIVQRDVSARPKKIIKKYDNSLFVDDGIVATTFRPEYNFHPKTGPYSIPTFEHQNMPFYQTSQLQVQQYSSNPIRYTRIQHNPGYRLQGLENHKNVQIAYKQQPLQDQLHGYQQNIQNIPVHSSHNIQYQQATKLQSKNIPAQYPKLVYQTESEHVQPESDQYESQETRTTQTENIRGNDENVGYHEVQVQNEKIPTQVYKNYGYENDEPNERHQAPIESQNVAKETNHNLHQSQIESGPEQNVFYQSKEYINSQFQGPQTFISDQPYIQVQLQNDQHYPNTNGYQSIPIQTHDERPSYIVGDSKLNQYRAEFQQYFNQPNNPQTNSQRSLSQQKDIPVIFLHAHGKLGLPFLPSTPLVKYPIEHDKRYGYEGIPTHNVTSYSLHHMNAVVERRNAHIAERRNIKEPKQFHGIDNIQPQQQIFKNWYPTPRPETIWQAGDPTADIEPETLVRQINETCAYFRFNETTEGTEDGSRNNIWNAGDYSAQREEEELIRSVNVTCQNFTLDVLTNFTGLYSLAEYCTQCLPSEDPNENKQDFDGQRPVGFIQQSGYLNFDPQRNIFPNYKLQQNGYQKSASHQGGFASVPQHFYQNYVPQKNSFSNPVLQQHRYSNVGSPQTAFSNIVLVKYPEVSQPFPFGSYNNRPENRNYQTQLVRQEA